MIRLSINFTGFINSSNFYEVKRGRPTLPLSLRHRCTFLKRWLPSVPIHAYFVVSCHVSSDELLGCSWVAHKASHNGHIAFFERPRNCSFVKHINLSFEVSDCKSVLKGAWLHLNRSWLHNATLFKRYSYQSKPRALGYSVVFQIRRSDSHISVELSFILDEGKSRQNNAAIKEHPEYHNALKDDRFDSSNETSEG